MTECTPGTKVIIIEDCRDGGIATGQTGTYEGRFGNTILGPNPRIRLQDGSVIWGYECWWHPVDKAGPLPQMQAELEKHKAWLRDRLAAAWLRDGFAAALEEEVTE